jgi:hypothetical protein
MDHKEEVNLGDLVEDQISGLKGIAISKMFESTGNLRIGLQPRALEGATSLPEALFYDFHCLKVLEKGVLKATPPNVEVYSVGDSVIDTAFHYEAVVKNVSTHLNGCVFYNVVPVHPKDMLDLGIKGPEFFHGFTLRSDRVRRKSKPGPETKPAAKFAPASKESTGGPVTRVNMTQKVPR